MKFSVTVLVAALTTDSVVDAWTTSSHRVRSTTTSNTGFSRTRASTSLRSSFEEETFDWSSLLSEGGPSRALNAASEAPTSALSRRRIALPSPHKHGRTTILASAFPAPTEAVSSEEQQAATDDDPYANAFDSQMQKINTYTEQRTTKPNLESRLKNMDLQDIISTLIVPSIAVFAAGRWVYNRAASRVSENTDATLDAFARELLYHDGDFDEMKLCYGDYSRKLAFLGPKKRETMLHRYLEAYAKKKTITPKAIASLSYVFTIAKLSEPAAAQLLVSLCRKMGPEKISSAGKLLFLGSRILRSSEGQEALLPIKEMIKGTYRDATVAETLVETSQQAIAEASYRATIQSYGKNQKSLTPGWETLGLDRVNAERIFGEEAEEGFVSAREAMYGGQSTRYDKKGRAIDKEGKLLNPDEAEDDDGDDEDSTESGPVSNAYECSQCGYTLFIAQGREFKFFGEGFKCPECGAPKDKFNPVEDFDD